MATLYILTGPAGVGKSTISHMIANQKEKSALIEGDEIYHQVVGSYVEAWKEGNHLKTFWKVCIESIKTYIEDGYDVVFNYIVNPADLRRFQEEFGKITVKFVVLLASEEELLRRDSLRPEDCQMKERCIVLLKSFKERNYLDKFLLDTTSLAPDEIIKRIEEVNSFLL